MKEFKLDKDQEARLKSWTEKHRLVHANGVRDCSGAWLRYIFLPTGMGCNVTVECIWCQDVKLILTQDFDSGDFLYNEDGTPNAEVWSGQ